MDIQSLHAFVTVAETGSFSGAAERLFLTQPAVSKRVASLESELGTPLFDRVGRRIALTEAGRALLPRARTILAEVEDSRRAITNLSGRVEGPLTMGTSHHIGLHRLPPVLREFHRRHPAVTLDIRFLDSEAACHAVARGELELALVTLPPQTPPPLAAVAVWDDPLAVMVAADHPLAKRGRCPLQALTAHPAILPPPGTYTRDLIEAAFERQGLRPEVAMATNYLETIKMLVAVGLGWSCLPLTLLDEQVQALEVSGFHLDRRLGLVEHTGRTPSNAGRAMRSLLLDTIS